MARHGDPAAAKSALADLSVSHCLAELLAERIPAGHTGRLLAGFFDRRAYVGAQLIELLLDQKQPAAALQHAEEIHAARLPGDAQRAGRQSPQGGQHASTAELCNWPSDVMALEYYLGPKRAWVFAVSATGQVTATSALRCCGKAS